MPASRSTGIGLYAICLLPNIFVLVISVDVEQLMNGNSCKTCHDLIINFRNGIEKTSKANFGGGNTHWEEKSLGSFKFSETRLLEINEQLCPKSGKSGDACHRMLEANEDAIESWWFNHYAKQSSTDLNQFLCVDKLGVCCPNGTYGPTCTDCLGGRNKPCGGNGRCIGDGTREGTGACSCNVGYKDQLCNVCDEAYYKEDGHAADSVVCKQCHFSCRSLCSGPGPRGCVDCAEGYSRSTQNGCVDDDECVDDKEICEDNQYCTNTAGSFRCTQCNAACESCSGPGDDDCTECARKHFMDVTTCKPCHPSCANACKDVTASSCDACVSPGWTMHRATGECVDDDECALGSADCEADEYCVNSVGSYACSTCHSACHGCDGPGNEGCKRCKDGYDLIDGKCVDVDECKSLESASGDTGAGAVQHKCTGSRVLCINTPGSFRCECEVGYVMSAGQCLPKPKNVEENNRKKTPETKSPPPKKSPTAKTKKSKYANGRSPWLELSLYTCALVVFVAIQNILKKRFYAQSVMTLVFWVYLFWFGLSLEKLALKYK